MTGEDVFYRAVLSADSRFDGSLYLGVTSTGIYCRPSCPAQTPKRENMRFYRTAAGAQAAGFRACKRCRPEAAPGSPEWNVRADLAGRAMRLIADGVVDREGVRGLAERLNYSERQLRRQLVAEVGASPRALARAQRARTAQLLLETTELPVGEVAFAAGFVSIRQFNDTIREVFASTPTELRRRAARRRGDRSAAVGSGIGLRLAYRAPLDLATLLGHLGRLAVPGLEEYDGRVYRRALALPHGSGVAEVAVDGTEPGRVAGQGFVRCELHLEDLRDLAAAVQRCRGMLDLDADPRAVEDVLGRDPELAALIAAAPGRRVPGCVDPEELAIRAVVGEDAGLPGAHAAVATIVERHGKPLTARLGAVTHSFPTAETLAELDPAELGVPGERREGFRSLTAALAARLVPLDAGAVREDAAARLARLPGLAAGTVAYVGMRALADPDALVDTDPGLRAALGDSPAGWHRADGWRPWRSYALQHLSPALPAPAAPAPR